MKVHDLPKILWTVTVAPTVTKKRSKKKQEPRHRCKVCGAVVSLAVPCLKQCKCDGIFCHTHRLPEFHDCSADFKADSPSLGPSVAPQKVRAIRLLDGVVRLNTKCQCSTKVAEQRRHLYPPFKDDRKCCVSFSQNVSWVAPASSISAAVLASLNVRHHSCQPWNYMHVHNILVCSYVISRIRTPSVIIPSVPQNERRTKQRGV